MKKVIIHVHAYCLVSFFIIIIKKILKLTKNLLYFTNFYLIYNYCHCSFSNFVRTLWSLILKSLKKLIKIRKRNTSKKSIIK